MTRKRGGVAGKRRLYFLFFPIFCILSSFFFLLSCGSSCGKKKFVAGELGKKESLDSGIGGFQPIEPPKYSIIIPDSVKPVTFQEDLEIFGSKTDGLKSAKKQIILTFFPDTTTDRVIEIIKSLKGNIVGGIPELGIIQIEIQEGDLKSKIDEAAAFDEVLVATPNFVLIPQKIPNDPKFSEQSWVYASKLNGAWDITTGSSSVTVAVIDFGFEKEHDDLSANIVSFDEMGSEVSLEHGTQVLGVIGAVGNNKNGIAGASWRVSLALYRIDGSILSLIKYMLDASDSGAKIINFSGGLGWSYEPSIHNPEDAFVIEEQQKLFEPVFRYLLFRDVVFVQAAGNYGWDAIWAGVGAPLAESFPNILIVGSSSESGNLSSFSSRGKTVKILAPGENILTTCLSSGYCKASGTSMSSGIVAGVSALIRALRPELTAKDVVDSILSSPENSEGYKVLGAETVLNAASTKQASEKITQTVEKPTISSEEEGQRELVPYAVNSAWTYNPGAGLVSRSSPAIYYDGTNWMIYYVTSNNASPYSATLRKIRDNGTSATLIWTFSIGSGMSLPSYSSPAILESDGTVFVASSAGIFAVYPNGTSRWWSPLDSGDTILYNSPSLSYEGYVYITSYGQAKLYSFVASTGAQRWVRDLRVGGAGNILGSPAIAPDGVVYVAVDYSASSTGALYAVNSDGSIKWGTQVGRLQSTPSIDCDGTVWICSLDSYCRKFSPSTGSVLTEFQIIDADTVQLSSCAIVDDKIFFGSVLNNRFHSYFTNSTRRWYLSASNDFNSSPVVSENLSIWNGNLNGTMYVVYDSSGTAEGASFRSAIWSSAALNPSGRLYVSLQNARLRAFSSSLDSSGLPDAAWPKFKHDNSNTGRLHLCTPDSITGNALSSSQINIQWTDKTAYETGYKVERCSGAGCTDFSEIGDAGAGAGYGSTVTYTDTLLSEYTEYCYRTRAYRTVGSNVYSNYTTQTVCVRTLPRAPSQLVATAVSDSQVDLTWVDNSSVEDSYIVERSVGGGGYSEIATLSANTTSYSDTLLNEASSHCYKVKACVGSNCSNYSNENCATTFPRSPTGPSATADSHTQITFEFWDNSEQEGGFEVERRTSIGSWLVVASLSSSPGSGLKVTYVDSGLSPSTSYWYRVRAFKGSVYSTYTAQVSATTQDQPATPPSAPSSAGVSESTGTYVKINWQDNSSDEEGFVVERCTGSGCDFSTKVTFQISQSNVTQFTDSSINELTTYRYRVYAYNNAGNSGYSNVTETTTDIAEPTTLQVYASGSTKVYLWWQENSSVEENIVVQSCEGGTCDFSVSVSVVLPANSTDYTWQSLVSETTYRFRVYAYSGGQRSDYSNVVSATLMYPPTNLFANPVLPSQINLSWSDNTSFEQNYKVERCQGAGCSSFAEIANLSANTTSYQDTGLSANTTYCYRVRAVSGQSTSDYSSEQCATTPNAGVAWTFAVASANTAYSSPSTGSDGRIFTTAWGTAAATRGFRAISRNRTSIWGPTLNLNFASSPANDGTYVYAGAENTDLYKRLASSGAAACNYNSGGAIRSSPSLLSNGSIAFGDVANYFKIINSSCALVGQYLTGNDVTSSPAIDITDRIYVGSDDGKLYAFSSVANPVWSYNVGSGWVVRGSPAISCTGDVYFTAQNGTSEIRLYAVDNSGNLKWYRTLSTAPFSLSATDFIPSPVIGINDIIYVSATSGGLAYLYSIEDLGSSSQVDWSLTTTGPAISTPAVDSNGNVWFAANNRIHKVVGGSISWYYAMGTQYVRSSPLISGDTGRIYIIGGNGLLYAFDTDAYPPSEPVFYQFKANPRKDGRISGLCSPINFSVNVLSHSSAQLTWEGHTIFEDGFYVERATSAGGPFSQIASLPAGSTQYTDSTLSEGTYYCWRVRSYRGATTSNYSMTICDTSKLGTPSDFSASPQSSTQISLSWTDNSSAESGYYVQRCEGEGCSDFATIATLPTNSSSYQDEGLPEATTYTYRVKAYSSTNESAYSNTSTATTYLHKPTGETATGVNYQRIEVYWNDNSSAESGYYVERCQGTGCSDFTTVATMPSNTTSYVDEPVSPSTTYRYRIRAFNDAGIYSLYSSIVEATTPSPPPTPPDAPSNLTSTAVNSTQVNLGWQDNSSIEDGTKIERMPEGSTFAQIATVGADVTYYEDSTVSCDVYYYYRVRAYNVDGDSGYSNTSTAVPMCAPTSLAATVPLTSQIDLTWADNSTKENNFELWRSQNGITFSAVVTLPANTTSYSDTGLQEATIYWYKVRVTNSTGVSSFSNTVSASTKPLSPSSLNAQPQSASSIKLVWTDNSSGESGFKIERCQGSGCTSFVEINDVSANTTTYTDSGLNPNTTYNYRVRAYKSGSDVGTVYSDYTPPAEATTYGFGSAVFTYSVPNGVTSTAAVDTDGTIIFGGANGTLYALNSDGSTKWTSSIGSPILSSPAITCEGDLFFGADNGRLYSAKSTNGTVNWSVLLSGSVRASPAVSNDGEVYVGTTAGVFYAVRATDGLVLRRYPTSGNIGAIYSSATIDGNTVVFASDGQRVYVLDRTTFAVSCSTAALGAGIRSSPAVDSTGIYVGRDDGMVIKINKSTCATMATSPVLGTQVRSSPAIYDYVYVGVVSASGAVVALDKTALTVVSSMLLSGASYSSPAIAEDGTIFIASNGSPDGYLWALTRSGSSFAVSFQYQLTGQPAGASPSINTNGNIYIGSSWGFYAVSGTSALSSSADYPKFRLNMFNSGGARLCAPTNLAASSPSTNQVDLTWTDNSENESGFGIERQPEGGTFSYLDSAPANATQYSDTTVSEGTYYCYRVTAYRGGDVSSYSNTACDLVYPLAPTELVVSTLSSSSLTSTWYDNSSQEDTYYVERCQGANCTSFSPIGTLPANSTSYQDTGLSEAQTYCYRVRNKRTYDSTTKYSSYSNSYCKTTKPAPPTSLSANAVAYNQIDLSWIDGSAGETGFYIERTTYTTSCVDSSWQQIANVGANIVSYSDTTVMQNTTYCYRTRAYKTVNSETVYSDYSNTATATTPDVPIPNPPSSLAITYQGVTTMAMSWTDNSDNEDGFGIERCEGVGCSNFAFRATVSADTIDYTDTGLIEGTTYCYRVTAYNGYGNSSPSNTACGTTQLLAPTGLTTGFSGSSINLYWTDNSSAEENYLVERNANGEGWSQIASLVANSTSYIDTTYSDGVSNCYRVRAKKGSVYSDYSNTSCTTTPLFSPSSLNVNSEASSPTSSAVTLVWNDNTANESGYYAYRSTDGASFAKVATMPANTTNTTLWGLSEGRNYWFKVSAYNGNDESGFSNTVSTNAVPYAPSNITVIVTATPRVYNIYWFDNSSVETSYQVASKPAGGSYSFETISQNSEFYSGQCSSESTCCVKVRAVNGAKYSSYSDEICIPVVSPPSPLVVEPVSSSSVKLKWQDSSTQETGYRIEVDSGSGWSFLDTTSPDTVTYVHSGLPSGVYCYRVRTITNNGNSDWSNTFCTNVGISECAALWTTSLGGSVTTAITYDDNNIYVGTATGYLISLNARSGSINWSTNLGGSVSSHLCVKSNGQTKRIIVGTTSGMIYSVGDNGSILSSVDIGGVAAGCSTNNSNIYLGTSTGYVFKLGNSLKIIKSVAVSGAVSSAPVIDEISGSIYFATENGILYSFDKNLNQNWSLALTGSPVIKSSPHIGPKGDIFFGADDGKVYKVSRQGSLVWTYNTAASSRSSPSIFLYGSQVTVFIGSDDNYLYALTDSGSTVSLLWSFNTGNTVRSSPSLAKDAVFIGSGNTFYSIRISDGVQSCSANLDSIISAPVVIKDSKVYVGTEGGSVYAFSSQRQKAEYSWTDFGNGNGRALTKHLNRAFAVEQPRFPVCLVSSYLYIPKIYDLDGDGYPEIIAGYANASGSVYVLDYNGNTKSGWPQTTSGAIWDVPSVGDIDGDSTPDIVVSNDAGYIYAFNPNGTVKSGFPVSVTCRVRATTLANIDSDSALEIIVTDVDTTSSCRKIRAFDGNGSLKWDYQIPVKITSFAVVNGSGPSAEIFLTDTSSTFYKFDTSGNLLNSWSIGGSYQLSSGAIGDIDNNGIKDFVFGSTESRVYVYDVNGTLRWSYITGETGQCMRPPSLADIDSDGNLEVAVVSAPCGNSGTSTVYVIDDNGTLLWSKAFSQPAFSSPLIADVNWDGSLEISILTQDSLLYVFGEEGGNSFESPYYLGSIQWGARGTPAATDIDLDGDMDIIFGDMSGCVRRFEFGIGSYNGSISWGSYRKNATNNANYSE